MPEEYSVSNPESTLITNRHQSREVVYYQLTKGEIENLRTLSNLSQILFALTTTAVGAFIAAVLQKYTKGYQVILIVEVIFWSALIFGLVFAILTLLTYKWTKKSKESLVS